MLLRGGCSPQPPQLCLAHLRGAGGQAAWQLLVLRWAPSRSQGCAQHLGVLRGMLWGRSVPGPPNPVPHREAHSELALQPGTGPHLFTQLRQINYTIAQRVSQAHKSSTTG